MRISATLAFTLIITIPFIQAAAQPIAVAELPVRSKLIYKLSGVYVGTKTYEVLRWSESEGRGCKLVRVHLEVNTSGTFIYKSMNSTSDFCYDEKGRPLSEVLIIPPEFNLSVERVKVTYWWKGEEVFPYKTEISLIGDKNESYVVLLDKGLVIEESGGSREEIRVSKENLSNTLPFVPERLTEPYVDISSLKLKEGFKQQLDSLKIEVTALQNVQTPAGIFPCYEVVMSGETEEGLPYSSTVYLTAGKPRFTAYYITDVGGIKQQGYIIYAEIPEGPEFFSPVALVAAGLMLAAVVLIVKMARPKKERGGQQSPYQGSTS